MAATSAEARRLPLTGEYTWVQVMTRSSCTYTNRLIWFDDLSYLEVAAFTELNEFTAPFLAFLEHHEGAKFSGTEVGAPAQAVSFLTGAGYPNVGPIPAPPLTIESTGDVVGLTPL